MMTARPHTGSRGSRGGWIGLIGLALVAAIAATAPAVGQEPPGIRGVDERRYVVRFTGESPGRRPHRPAQAWCLAGGPAYRFVDGSLRGQLLVAGHPVPDLEARTKLVQPGAYDARMPIIDLLGLEGRPIQWEIAYEVMVGSTEVDERTLAAITWPREYPAKVKPALAATVHFPAKDPLVAQAVEDAIGGPIRMTAPYVVAKRIVGYCAEHVRTVSDQNHLQRPFDSRRADRIHRAVGPITWYQLGTIRAAREGVGSDQDLVALCVTTLRAAGIPARVVVGVHEVLRTHTDEDGRKRSRQRNELVAWGEFYLQQAGWIPFDPIELQSSVPARPIDAPWRGFGNVKLKDRVPLTYDFALAGTPPRVEFTSRAIASPPAGR